MPKETEHNLGKKVLRSIAAVAMFGSSLLPHQVAAQQENTPQAADHQMWVICLGKDDPIEFTKDGFIAYGKYTNYTGDLAVVRLSGFRDQSYTNLLIITQPHPITGVPQQMHYFTPNPEPPEVSPAPMPRGLSFQVGYFTPIDISGVSPQRVSSTAINGCYLPDQIMT